MPRVAHTEVPERLAPPTIVEMTRTACRQVLRRHTIGRMAFALHDRVDITPIHYILDGEWLFGRTSHGAKMQTLAHAPWVAFEVDEVDGPFEWRSVIVRGTFYQIEPTGTHADLQRWERAMEQLRRLVSGTGTSDDPVPFRDIAFGIHVDSITGRKARTGTTAPPKRNVRRDGPREERISPAAPVRCSGTA